MSDALLDIRTETKLLAEIKDIRDELNILNVVLESQMVALEGFEEIVLGEIRSSDSGSGSGNGGSNRRATDAIVAEIRKRSREQLRRVEYRLRDLDRMDNQAHTLYRGLTDLLDLKQKHSNALEARFAGDQAVIAARQGQTIMVFTIVTIVFLPMSFIAAFFAINLPEWEGRLNVAYVSKYMFGIGLGISIPLVAMAVTFTDISDGLRNLRASLGGKLRGKAAGSDTSGGRGSGAGGGVADPLEDRLQPLSALPTKGRPSTHYTTRGPSDVEHWRSFGPPAPNGGGLRSRDREMNGDPYGRLSPVPYLQRKVSIGSGNNNNNNGGIAWARPSMERGRRDVGADLERGRSIGVSPRRW